MLATAAGATVVMAGELVAINHGAPRELHVVTAVCVALQGGITPAALALLADLTAGEDEARGTTMGLFAFLMGVGQLAGVLLGGPVVARWQLDGLLALTTAFALVTLVGLAAMGARATAKR
jgi:MFS family permease